MKIVHLTSVHSPFDDRIFCKEAKSLVRAGYEVTVVAPHSQDEFSDGVRIKAVPLAKRRLTRMIFTTRCVYREAVRQRGDVYHFHDPELIPAGLLLRVRGCKVIYDIHEDVPKTILDKYYLPRWVRGPLAWFAERAENLSSKLFSTLLTSTPTIAQRFRIHNPDTLVVQNYALPEEFEPKAGTAWSLRTNAVAYVGMITHNRGIQEMLSAIELLPDILNAKLKLVGPFGPEKLRNEAAQLPGWKRVEALGVLNRAGVAGVLASVRAGLVVLHPEPRYVCSQPIKLFECMSAGIPVIASDFPLWREIIGTAACGLLVNPTDPRAIANAIEYILTHPEEAEAMGCRGRRAVEEKYNWRLEERKLLDCYARLGE